MMEKIGADVAIRDRLVQMGTEVGVSVDLYDIGVPLVGEGYLEEDIVNALLSLQSQKIIDLTGTNRLILRTAL